MKSCEKNIKVGDIIHFYHSNGFAKILLIGYVSRITTVGHSAWLTLNIRNDNRWYSVGYRYICAVDDYLNRFVRIIKAK